MLGKRKGEWKEEEVDAKVVKKEGEWAAHVAVPGPGSRYYLLVVVLGSSRWSCSLQL